MVLYKYISNTSPVWHCSVKTNSPKAMVRPLAWLKQLAIVQFSLVPLLVGNYSLHLNTPTHVLNVCVGVCLTELISHQTVLQQQDQQSEGGRKQPWHWTHLEPHFQVPGTLRPVLLSHGKQWKKMGLTQPLSAIWTFSSNQNTNSSLRIPLSHTYYTPLSVMHTL